VSTSPLLRCAAVAAIAVTLSACASTTAPSGGATAERDTSGARAVSGTAGDITQFCPQEPTKVAYAKGSSNAWTKIALAELQDEARKCPTITDVLFTDAQGDQQKAISDVNALVAQGVQAIVIQPEFGAAQLPSMRAAVAAGVAVVPLISDPGGAQGTDYQDFARRRPRGGVELPVLRGPPEGPRPVSRPPARRGPRHRHQLGRG
jgi:ribose transport system substrate-binding protein